MYFKYYFETKIMFILLLNIYTMIKYEKYKF